MFKIDCQKDTASNTKMTGKQYAKKKENTYYLVSKKKADNKEIRAILLVNKMVTRRSVCFVCTS